MKNHKIIGILTNGEPNCARLAQLGDMQVFLAMENIKKGDIITIYYKDYKY